VLYNWDRMFFARHELRLKNHLIIENCRIKRPNCLHSLRYTASNLTIYDIYLLIDCKLAYYVEILTMLGGAVRRGTWPVADIWFFHRDSIWSHRALCVKQFMAKGRTAIYRCTAHLIILHCIIQCHHFCANRVAAFIIFVDYFQPSAVVQFI